MRAYTAFVVIYLVMMPATAIAQDLEPRGWDFGVIPYTIAADVADDDRARVMTAFEAWAAVLPVRFIPRTTQAGHLAIDAALDSPSAIPCSAPVGQAWRGLRLAMNVAGCSGPDAIVRAVGQALGVVEGDWRTVSLYDRQLTTTAGDRPTELPRYQFDHAEIALAIERLHALFMSRYGMKRSGGLITSEQIDFASVSHWILDVYVGARSQGWSADDAFAIVLAGVTQSLEWAQANPQRMPLVPPTVTPAFTVDDREFTAVMEHLDGLYRSPEGMRRQDGLAINGGPDFQALATWVFEVYLTERLRGISPEAAWTVMENGIRESEEWQRRHSGLF